MWACLEMIVVAIWDGCVVAKVTPEALVCGGAGWSEHQWHGWLTNT